MHSFSSFQTHRWFSDMGDHIGMESGVDLIPHYEEVVIDGGGSEEKYQRQHCDQRWEKRKKEYPPPIQLHMPWVLKRYYTSDGRLIIREEKVRQRQYFRAKRLDGRLTLQLIHLVEDDNDDEDEREDKNDESEQCHEDGGGDDKSKNRVVEGEFMVKLSSESRRMGRGTVVMGSGRGGKVPVSVPAIWLYVFSSIMAMLEVVYEVTYTCLVRFLFAVYKAEII
ncbi:unnamed protein product [Camellia sinensis]